MGSFKKWMLKRRSFFDEGMVKNTFQDGLNFEPYLKPRRSQTDIQLIVRDFNAVGACFRSALSAYERFPGT
jgi:hypothetical protein